MVLSVAPLSVIPPPSAVVSVGVETFPISIFLSSTTSVVESIVVVVPLTVRSFVTVRLLAIVMSFASLSPVTASFAILTVVTEPSASPAPDAALVIRPWASTVMFAVV